LSQRRSEQQKTTRWHEKELDGGGTKRRALLMECSNQAKKGGVCKKHEAKAKRWSSEGCANIVVKKGVLYMHVAWNIAQTMQQ
jgi:hypothetical protein